MREIEVKVLDVRGEELAARLLDRGARLDFDQTMHALYFDTPGRELSRRRDSLRIRREGARVYLNYKAHLTEEEMKVKDELETEIGDFDTARRILTGLGYEVWLEMEKRRRSYSIDTLPGLHFVLDRFVGELAYVPEFLEVEADSPELLLKGLELAGFTLAQTVPWNAHDLIEHYRRREPRQESPSR